MFSIDEIKSHWANDRSFVGCEWLLDRLRETAKHEPTGYFFTKDELREFVRQYWENGYANAALGCPDGGFDEVFNIWLNSV